MLCPGYAVTIWQILGGTSIILRHVRKENARYVGETVFGGVIYVQASHMFA